MLNAPDEDLTPEGQEDSEEQTEQQAEGETSSVKETEPPKQDTNVQAAIQRARERENAERARAKQLEEQLNEVNARLEEVEMRGLSEAEQYRTKYEKAEQEKQRLQQEIETEKVIKEYRSFLSEKESEHPKAVATLKKLMDRNIYPVGGDTRQAFEENFEFYASELEGTPSTPSVGSNPAYTPPEEIDFKTMSVEEMRNVLPKADKKS